MVWRSNMSISKALRRCFHPRLSWKNTFQGNHVLEDIHEYHFDRRQLIIYLIPERSDTGPDEELIERCVDSEMADRFEMNMNLAASMAMESGEPILVVMATKGGDHMAGMRIASTLLHCPVPVTVYARSEARSMSSIIPLFADKFVIDPAAKYMIHRGEYGFAGLDQNACTDDLERRKARELMYQIYISTLKAQGIHCRKREASIRKLIDDLIKQKIDVWFEPQDAVTLGFVDEVFDGDWASLRTRTINTHRRERLRNVLNSTAEVDVTVYWNRYETETLEG